MVGISGLLVFDEGCFLQVLEGDDAAILPLYQQIKQDRRHRNVVKLIHEPIAKRRFAKWGMRLVAEGEPAPAQPYGSATALDNWRELFIADAFAHITEDRVRTVLDAFTRGRWHQRVVAAPDLASAQGKPTAGCNGVGELFIPGNALSAEQQHGLPPQAPLFAFQPIWAARPACRSTCCPSPCWWTTTRWTNWCAPAPPAASAPTAWCWR